MAWLRGLFCHVFLEFPEISEAAGNLKIHCWIHYLGKVILTGRFILLPFSLYFYICCLSYYLFVSSLYSMKNRLPGCTKKANINLYTSNPSKVLQMWCHCKFITINPPDLKKCYFSLNTYRYVLNIFHYSFPIRSPRCEGVADKNPPNGTPTHPPTHTQTLLVTETNLPPVNLCTTSLVWFWSRK